MKRNWKYHAGILFLILTHTLLMSGCARIIMSAPLVSMTKSSLSKRAKVKNMGRVEAEFCASDDSITGAPVKGLIDEAIMKAQKKAKADYIRDAVFTQSGFFIACVGVQGEALALRGR